MKPARFSYVRPASLGDAIALLAAAGGDAKVLAGGQSLVPLLNMRLARPSVLIDLNGVRGLDAIAPRAGGGLAVGALVRHADLASWPAVRARAPLLAEAARHVGHPAIRNRGTIGGSVAHGDPAAELPAALVALGAEIAVDGPRGPRAIAAHEFFTGPLATALAPDEIVTEIRVPASAPGWGFAELARRPGDFALAGVAAVVHRAPGDPARCERAVLVGFGLADRPVRLAAAEALLSGAALDGEAVARASAAAAEDCSPADDVHASAEYRRHLACVLAEDALRQAVGRAANGAAADDWPAPRPRAAVRPRAARRRLPSPAERSSVRFTVNGQPVTRVVEARRSLAEVLREELGLTGSHVGCEHGVCGACTVLIDGRTARSCLIFAAQLDGAAVTTIEGLTPDGGLSPLQQAFCDAHALQCGFCTPGMIAAATELLAADPAPSEEAIRDALAGNLCMCTGYVNIVRAVRRAAEHLRAAEAAR